MIEKVKAFKLLSDNYAQSDAPFEIIKKQLVNKNGGIFQSYADEIDKVLKITSPVSASHPVNNPAETILAKKKSS